jgi:hypothetical protein
MREDRSKLISVFSTNEYALFHMAKSILDENSITYFSGSDYLINLESSIYPLIIKVPEENAEISRKLLSELEENKFNSLIVSKKPPVFGYLIISIIIIFVIAMILIFSLK